RSSCSVRYVCSVRWVSMIGGPTPFTAQLLAVLALQSLTFETAGNGDFQSFGLSWELVLLMGKTKIG
ncbi:MAG TPA: hypothetical protein VHS80_08095, partial [Chthoniobacterales bacterium]|nr:hypothetical protein [Chthoniobacterales bacterium]